MTGFGHTQVKIGGVQIDITIKTVNSRYLDVKPHLPKKYLSIENEIVKITKEFFRRGSCDIYIQRAETHSQDSLEIFFQMSVAEDWMKQMRAALKQLKVDAPITVQDVLSIPSFVQVKENNAISPQEKKAFFKEFKKAVELCAEERLREGKQLIKQCLHYVDTLSELSQKMQSMRGEFTASAKENLESRLQTVLSSKGITLDSGRLMQEVAILIERTDIEEELVRLQEHIIHVKKLLQEKKESIGKKLDFYAQELLREVNTMGSKCSSAKITELVVSAKNTIEQLREQIQNLE